MSRAGSRVSSLFTARSASSHSNSRGNRRLREFDQETEAELVEIQSRHQKELRDFENNWFCTHKPEYQMESEALQIRDLEARQSVMHENGRELFEKKKAIQRLLKKHRDELDEFERTRTRERNLIFSDPSSSKASLPCPERTLPVGGNDPLTKSSRKKTGSFVVSRGRFCPRQILVGRFKKPKEAPPDDDFGDMLDLDNLDRVLERKDSRFGRFAREQVFLSKFDDRQDRLETRSCMTAPTATFSRGPVGAGRDGGDEIDDFISRTRREDGPERGMVMTPEPHRTGAPDGARKGDYDPKRFVLRQEVIEIGADREGRRKQ